MTERTFVNAVGVFRVTDEGSVVQVEGKPVARPVEYVLSQYLAGNVSQELFAVCCGDPADCDNCEG